MAFYPVKIPWGCKPPMGSPLNLGHPITRGLLSAILINEGAGNHSFDSVRNQFGADDNGVTASFSGPLGRVYGSGYYGGERLGLAFSAHVDELTLIIRYATNDVSVVTRNALCTSSATGSDGQWVRNVSGAYEARYTDGYTPKTVTGTTAPANGVFRTVAMTVKKNGYLRLYVDGKEEGTAQTTHATNPLYVSGTFLKVGNKAGGYNTYTNTLTVDFAYAFQRELSATEIAAITANPNIIYQPRALWIPIAVGGGGTTYTSTGAIDALIQRTGIVQTASIDALLQAAKSSTISVDSLIVAARSGIISTDALLYIVFSTSTNLNALVSAVKSGSISIDAIIAGGTGYPNLYLDALLRSVKSGIVSIDALVRAVKYSAVGVDAILSAARIGIVSLDAIIGILSSCTIGLDSLIQLSKSRGIGLDAIIGEFSPYVLEGFRGKGGPLGFKVTNGPFGFKG